MRADEVAGPGSAPEGAALLYDLKLRLSLQASGSQGGSNPSLTSCFSGFLYFMMEMR